MLIAHLAGWRYWISPAEAARPCLKNTSTNPHRPTCETEHDKGFPPPWERNKMDGTFAINPVTRACHAHLEEWSQVSHIFRLRHCKRLNRGIFAQRQVQALPRANGSLGDGERSVHTQEPPATS